MPSRAVPALHLLLDADDHVVAQVVEAELVVRAVGDVAVVLRALLVGRRVVGDDRADLQAEEPVDPAHPLGVALGEVVVDRDEVHAAAGERVQVRRQRRDERLALAGLHLRDPAEVQGGAAHDLHVEVALAEHPLAGLADGGEGLGQQVVEHVGDQLLLVLGVARVAASARSTRRLELGGLGRELLVGEPLDLGLERVDLRDDRLDRLEPLALARVEDLVERPMRAVESTGRSGPPVGTASARAESDPVAA